MPALAAQPEAVRERAIEERLALAAELPAAALALMARHSPTVLRAVMEQATTVPEEPGRMTQLKAVSDLRELTVKVVVFPHVAAQKAV